MNRKKNGSHVISYLIRRRIACLEEGCCLQIENDKKKLRRGRREKDHENRKVFRQENGQRKTTKRSGPQSRDRSKTSEG